MAHSRISPKDRNIEVMRIMAQHLTEEELDIFLNILQTESLDRSIKVTLPESKL